MNNIEQEFLRQVERYSHKKKITDLNTKIGDYGLDSLDVIELVMYLENKFGFEVDMDNITSSSTLQEIIDLLVNEHKDLT